jgi:hypothetical protein
MIIAEIIYSGNSYTVKVNDVFEGSGRKVASVEALTGEPFRIWTHGGPVASATMTVAAASLLNVRTQPEPGQGPTLLDLALEKARPVWHSGESLWIYGRRAFLKNDNCSVKLYVVGYPKGLEIFWLDLGADRWRVNKQAALEYTGWVNKAKQALNGETKKSGIRI